MKSDFKMCKTITIDNYYIYILFINYNVMCVWVMNVDVSRQIFYVYIFIKFKKCTTCARHRCTELHFDVHLFINLYTFKQNQAVTFSRLSE